MLLAGCQGVRLASLEEGVPCMGMGLRRRGSASVRGDRARKGIPRSGERSPLLLEPLRSSTAVGRRCWRGQPGSASVRERETLVTPYRCLRLDAAGGSRAAERSRARRRVHRWYLRGRRRLRAPRGSRQVTPSRRPDPPQRPSGASGEQAEAAGADPQSSPRRRPCSPRLVSQLPRRLDGRCCCIALVCCCLQRGSPPSRPTAPRR